MRRIIAILLAILTIYMLIGKVGATNIEIPDSAIRLRIIPNSNSLLDQEMKQKVKDYIEKDIYIMFDDIKSIEEARIKIDNSIPIIENNIEKIFKENSYNMPFKVNYGMNYFPNKNYKDVEYPSGEYESLVIEIGNANGDNWWCVLFPNLCLLDSSSDDDVEYKLGVMELLNRIL